MLLQSRYFPCPPPPRAIIPDARPLGTFENLDDLTKKRGTSGGGGRPCSLTFSLFVPRLINLLTTYHRPQFPFPPKKREEKRHQKKLIKEENRLFVTFNLCVTSSQAFERNAESIRVGWVSKLTSIFLFNHHNTLTRRNLPSSLLVLIFSMWYLFVLGPPPHIPCLLRCMVTDSTWPIKWDW